MNNLDKQYTDLLQDILDNGFVKQVQVLNPYLVDNLDIKCLKDFHY
jgi:hypothetical protein